jgi:hypothetical protein
MLFVGDIPINYLSCLLQSADDESGDIQLHYGKHMLIAVNIDISCPLCHQTYSSPRAGNLRVDPSCAMIRNVNGYCPLHTAV